ncbi:MAG: NUDIX domain-containing protein [Chthoniobacterales bacterium]
MNSIKYRPNVAAILQREDGQILVGERRDYSGAWQFPQGGVDAGESLEQALRREIWEEIGLESDAYEVGEMRGPYRYEFMRKRKNWGFDGQEQHYFLLHAQPGCSPKVEVRHPEFQKLRWIWPPEFQLVWLPEMKKPVYRQVFLDFFQVDLND